MPNNTTNILITSIGSTTALSAAKALRSSKNTSYRLTGTDINLPYEIAGTIFFDSVHTVPLFSEKSYIESLRKICEKEQIQFIIPIVDAEIEQITKHRSVFESIGVHVLASSYETVSVCNDKIATTQTLQAKGLRVPPVYVPEDLLKLKKNGTKQLFIKPRRGVSSVGCYKINSFEELDFFLPKVADPIIQEILEGNQYVIDVVCDKNSKAVVAVPRHEISAKSGLGVKAITVNDKALCDYAIRIAETLNIVGPANIEVFKKEDTISFIEINPRLSAGSIISAAAGVNLPEISIDIFSGKKIEEQKLEYKSGVYMARYWEEVYYYNHKILKLS